MKIRSLVLLVLITFNVSVSLAKNPNKFFIAKTGSSLNDGSKLHPFSSLEDAKCAIRNLKKENRMPKGDITVWLRKGTYELASGFSLTMDDSGTESGTITFCAYQNEKVVIAGGKSVSFSAIKPISRETANRIAQKEVIPKICEIDLSSLGISDYGTTQISGFRRPYVNAAMELFINGAPYHLSRYPNKEQISIKPEDIIDKGILNENDYFAGSIRFSKEKLSQWSQAQDIMVRGNFKYAWANDQTRVKSIDAIIGEVRFADAHMYGISSGKAWNQYYFYNLLEEIDEPGEYYIDRQKGILYFYPLEEPKPTDNIMVSMLEDALVTIKGANYIKFRDLIFEDGRGIGIYMENSSFNMIENCTIRNMGVVGVCVGMGSKPPTLYRHPSDVESFYPNEKLSGRLGSLHELLYENTTFNREAGNNNGILNCKIENTGCGGISLGGGDRLTLKPGGNYVKNSEFTNCGRLDYSYKAPVNIDGVGNKIEHCQFNSSPATTIYIHGNNHIIEYNVINEACNFMDDQGAIYIGRDPSEFGNIIRYNFFKNIGHFGVTMAVYYDDGACGTQLYGNIFYNAGSKTVLVGGGNNNPIFNNIFINSKLAIHLDNRLENWAKKHLIADGLFEIRLKKVNYNNPPYSTAYPRLASYFKDFPQVPKYNDIRNNLFVSVKSIHNGEKVWGPIHEDNVITTEDPGFIDALKLNFTLKKNSAVFKKLPEFKAIPFSQMGLNKGK